MDELIETLKKITNTTEGGELINAVLYDRNHNGYGAPYRIYAR